MAATPVEYRATLYDLATKSSRQVYLVGEMHRSDLSVGGGPIYPPSNGGGGDPPLVIWGPDDPRPSPPIYLPPDVQPPGMSPGGEKPPPAGEAGWGFYDGRWGFFPAPTDAQPKS